MYNRKLWQDQVRDPARTYKATQNADGTTTLEPAGKLVQQGTNQSAENFNNMEDAIQDTQIALQIAFQHQLQFERDHEDRVSGLESENTVESGTVTLTNSMNYPFNNSAKTINLTKARKTTNYLVEARVTEFSGGLPGDISVSDKALNGFKLAYDGSAKSVTIKYIVKGGILS